MTIIQANGLHKYTKKHNFYNLNRDDVMKDEENFDIKFKQISELYLHLRNRSTIHSCQDSSKHQDKERNLRVDYNRVKG